MPGHIGLAVSFGGTKVAAALVDTAARRILIQSERIEWIHHAHHARAVSRLVVATASRLLQSLRVGASDIGVVGIAWPGPGKYSDGEVQATFVPGFHTSNNIFALLGSELKQTLGINPSEWHCCLDVMARARGELLRPDGVWTRGRFQSGILLNVATGVGGVIVRNGSVVNRVPGLGETYGQWGRFLVCKRNSRLWQWRPTDDGSMPSLDRKSEVRLTDLCGGPALATQFYLWRAKTRGDANVSWSAFAATHGSSRLVETPFLRAISEDARSGNEAARAFVQHVGSLIGAALRRLPQSLGLDGDSPCVMLTGGIGENFGLPRRDANEPDLLLSAASSAFANASMRWVRSRAGLSAELLGAVI